MGQPFVQFCFRRFAPSVVCSVFSVSAYFPLIDIDLVTSGPQQMAATFSHGSSQTINMMFPLLCLGSGLSVSLRQTMLLTSLQQMQMQMQMWKK